MTTQTSVNNLFSNNDVEVKRSEVGGDVEVEITNTDNTSTSSRALLKLETGGASGGDASIVYSTTATDFSFGMDNTASDSIVISNSSSLGTTNVVRCISSGIWTYPLNPCFSVNLNGVNQATVTGNGTVYKIPFSTEIYDIGSNFNTTTYTFTAPVDGIYLFSCSGVSYNGLAKKSTITSIISTSMTLGYEEAHAADSVDGAGKVSGLIELDSSDEVYITFKISGEISDRCGLRGNVERTNFQGALVS